MTVTDLRPGRTALYHLPWGWLPLIREPIDVLPYP